jgi:hypothetical protein
MEIMYPVDEVLHYLEGTALHKLITDRYAYIAEDDFYDVLHLGVNV